MNPKKPVFRMDVLTRKPYPEEKLFRLTLSEGKLVYDKNHTLKGRGIYVLKDKENLEKTFRKGVLKRCSHTADYENLFKELSEDVK